MAYNRPPKSEAEIASLPLPGTTEREAHVRAHLRKMSPETLVYLMREAEDRKDTPCYDLCARALIHGEEQLGGRWLGGHCEKIIYPVAMVGGFHLDPEVLKDFRSLCHQALFLAIRDHGPGQRYFEERFLSAFKRLCITVARHEHRARKLEQGHLEALEAHFAAPVGSTRTDSTREEEGEALLAAAILALPERQRQVALLVIQEGRPVESVDGPSVASILGLTSRRIRQLLQEARESLVKNAAIRDFLDGR